MDKETIKQYGIIAVVAAVLSMLLQGAVDTGGDVIDDLSAQYSSSSSNVTALEEHQTNRVPGLEVYKFNLTRTGNAHYRVKYRSIDGLVAMAPTKVIGDTVNVSASGSDILLSGTTSDIVYVWVWGEL